MTPGDLVTDLVKAVVVVLAAGVPIHLGVALIREL